MFSDRNKPDIILTDKKDIVVVLKYNNESMIAPIILGKGRNTYAQKIINLGNSKNIPIVEDKELTNDLYSFSKQGQPISCSNYEKVAEIYGEYADADKNTDKENINYFDDVFEMQRQKDYEILSLNMPEKVKIDVSKNIYNIIRNKLFKINICGVVLQNIKAEENSSLKNDEYCIKVNGLAIHDGSIKYSNIEPFDQINLYLSECLKRFVKQLIGRDDIVYFLSQIKEQYPVLVNEIMKHYSIGEIRKILHGLLDENVSIRNIVTILEAMADFENDVHNFDVILENVRKAIGMDICFPYLHNNILKVICFEHEFEKYIIENVINKDGMLINEIYIKKIHEAVSDAANILNKKNIKPVLVCSLLNRKLLKNIIKISNGEIIVISTSEIPKEIKIELVMELKN